MGDRYPLPVPAHPLLCRRALPTAPEVEAPPSAAGVVPHSADAAVFLADGRIVDLMDAPTAERVLERTLDQMTKTTNTVRGASRLRQAVSLAAGAAAVAAFTAAAIYFDLPLLPF